MLTISQNNSKTSFSGSNLVEKLHYQPKGNALDKVNHKTSLFRDLEILNFVANSLSINSPKGGTIIHYASSTGEELYSFKMLLQKINPKGKYNFIGYDIGPKAVEQAKQGIFLNSTDSVFLRGDSFCENIEKLGIKDRNQLATLSQLLRDSFNINENALQCLPKDAFKKKVRFDIGNINCIEKQELPKDIKAIFFKSAFYHITGNHWSNPLLKKENISNPENLKKFLQSGINKITHVIQNIHKELPQKGLFTIGNSEYDHFFNVPMYSEKSENGIIDLFNDKKIKNILKLLLKENNLPTPCNEHKEGLLDLVLRREGFEPVKCSDMMENISSKKYIKSTQLASVWAKN